MDPKETAATETKTETPAASPEKGEVRGTLLQAGDDGLADWGTTTRIVEKKAITEAGDTVGGEDTPTEEEKAAEEAKTETKPAETPEIVADLLQAIEVEDPGQYTPKDYSFEVMVYDGEGKNGRSRKIASVEAWDSLLDSDPNFGNATALLKAQRAATKMETALERDQETYNEKKAAYDEAVKNEEAQTAATTQISNEINYLVDRGELPRVAAEFVNANWSDPAVAAQPGVKEQVALLAYMAKENAARTKAGLAPMTSALDAWNAYQLDESKKTTQTRQTEAAEQRKAAGARVAGVAPNPTTAAPRGIMVGRAGSLRDLNATDWSVGA